MNDRIKKLKELATSYTWNGDGVTEELDADKFAELLVRECAKIAEKEQAYNERHGIHVNIDQCILIEFGL
jgi:hypothetical protein